MISTEPFALSNSERAGPTVHLGVQSRLVSNGCWRQLSPKESRKLKYGIALKTNPEIFFSQGCKKVVTNIIHLVRDRLRRRLQLRFGQQRCAEETAALMTPGRPSFLGVWSDPVFPSWKLENLAASTLGCPWSVPWENGLNVL